MDFQVIGVITQIDKQGKGKWEKALSFSMQVIRKVSGVDGGPVVKFRSMNKSHFAFCSFSSTCRMKQNVEHLLQRNWWSHSWSDIIKQLEHFITYKKTVSQPQEQMASQPPYLAPSLKAMFLYITIIQCQGKQQKNHWEDSYELM